MKDIRHIATSFNGQRIALAEFTSIVQIFDITDQQVLSEFETVLDFGGRRIVIDEGGEICVCGCWERYGICGYEAATGKLIWQRKDLKKVQHIQTLRSDKNILFTEFETGASRLLDIRTGADVGKLSGVEFYFESKFQSINVFDKSAKIQIVDRATSKVKANIERQSFATLDISFAPESVLITESAGPLSCYDTADGKLKWRNPLNEDGHFLRVSYNENSGVYLGISWPLVSRIHGKKLKYINRENGQIEKEISINNPAETEFAFDGKILVTSDRELINIESGERKSWI
jgi:outer membrane protein assembly factor BamB